MSKYIDDLLNNGFSLEELYKKGIVDEVSKEQEETVEEVKEDKEESTEEVKESVEYISKNDFEESFNNIKKMLEELKKTIHSNNIASNSVDNLKDENQLTIEQALNGLAFGG